MTIFIFLGIVGIQGEKLSETAQGTAKVLKFFDDLMDSVNGYSLYPSSGKPLRSAVSRCTDHFEFWVEARQTLRKMYYQAEGTEERLRPPSLVNWTVTINGIIDIFEMLEQGNVNHLKCRRLNQDPIENFFGQIRQQGLRDTNPTCSHFKNHFKTLLINNFSSRLSMSANCESENSKNIIVAVKKFITVDVVVPSRTDFCSFPSEIPNFALQYISKVSLGYVSGFITKYVKKDISSCEVCIRDIFSENPVDEWHALIAEKEYLKTMPAKLKYCHLRIIQKFAELYNITMHMVPQLAYKANSVGLLVNFIKSKISLPLSCPNHKESLNSKLIEKFTFFLGHNWTVGINRALSGRDLRPLNNDPVIKQAKEIYLKNRRYRK
ncbi:unnamed protein product [Acanthoscelides obtectus]|uniref:Transposable element P transposase-like RNase H C-terminal domain-containing protein n=1 Tax=Acanthoscelides obtectus TaxID=200917 RepID=A0A9P0MCY3_ACAOB|nr:unnamed protein product [Acanthoscelides obtectus]CAK1654795.1 hypothetical protein AOBTE_LOCUS18848 [Acanthoscelides obtectus]